jgi:hypothetical protein
VGLKFIKGHSYYYESIREGGAHRTVYRGAGGLALRLAAAGRLARARRDQAADFDRVERLFRCAMAAAGFHRHARGVWRRKRGGGDMRAMPPAVKANRSLLLRALDGDQAALPGLRELLDRSPDASAIIDVVGSPKWFAEDRLLKWFAADGAGGANGLMVEAGERKLRALGNELAGDHPEPLERLLAERVAWAWFALYVAESRAARDGLTPGAADFYQKTVDRCGRRFHQAVRALASFRRLALPDVRVTLSKVDVRLRDGPAAAAPHAPTPLEAP